MKKRTTEEFIQLSQKIHNGKYSYEKTVYTGKRYKVIITCPIHGDFEQIANSHIRGIGCPKCGKEKSIKSRKTTVTKFVEKADIIHNNKYDYSKVEFNNLNEKVIIICPIHGEFEQKANHHLSGHGCPKCHRDKTKAILSDTKEDFIQKAIQVHGDKYDYSKVEYVNSKIKVCIICSEHGEFWQTPYAHIQGKGCYSCGKLKISSLKKNTTEEFIEKAKNVHGEKYDYSNVKYIDSQTKICIICPYHGEFWQTPTNHLSKIGCPKCGVIKTHSCLKSNTEEFINKANQIHNSFYDYSKVKYIDAHTKVCIICPKHGEFYQTPNMHLLGQGCPKCGQIMSKAEDEIVSLLSDLNPIQRDRTILNGREIDIYIPSHKLGIEYNGLRWHTDWFGGKDRHYHISKLNGCNKQGINLIQIFEDEWVNHREICESKLKHTLGLEDKKEKIYARKCSVKEISNHQAKEFLDKNHIQGFSAATVYLGLFYNDKLIGVMDFLEQYKGMWDLNRFATDIEYNCVGAGGKLFKYFTTHYEFSEIKSFADRRWTINYNNNLYTKLGFKLVEFTKPNYTYFNQEVSKYARFHKFAFRKHILNRKYGLPLTMTETEMVKELGYDRIWDCGLIKYVYKK